MKTIDLMYSINFGKLDNYSGEWPIELTDAEEAAYNHAVETKTLLAEVPELQSVLERAREEIMEQELENAREAAEDDGEEFDESDFDIDDMLKIGFVDPTVYPWMF